MNLKKLLFTSVGIVFAEENHIQTHTDTGRQRDTYTLSKTMLNVFDMQSVFMRLLDCIGSDLHVWPNDASFELGQESSDYVIAAMFQRFY